MDDKTLVEAFLRGNEDAFDQIYNTYSAMCYRSAYLICQNEADAQDVLQDTFITFYHKAQRLRKPESLKYWLLRCVTSKSRDLLRKRKSESPAENIRELADWNSDERIDTAEVIVFRECIRALEPKYREVLVLHYYNGLSVREIAAVTGQLAGTVKSRLYYARQRLKEAIEEGQSESARRPVAVSAVTQQKGGTHAKK